MEPAAPDTALPPPLPSLALLPPGPMPWMEALGGIAGLVGCGLAALLPVGGAPMASPAQALGLAALPVGGGLLMSAVTLVVLSQQVDGGDDRHMLRVAGAVLEGIGGAGRLALAVLPVILLFATTAQAPLYRLILCAAVGGVGAMAVAGVAARIPARSPQARRLLAAWCLLSAAMILTLLARIA